MSTLKTRLDRIRDGFKSQAPPEALAVMAQAQEELSGSGIMDRIAKVGDAFPAFELPDTAGRMVSSKDLLRQSPLVVTFYRGVW